MKATTYGSKGFKMWTVAYSTCFTPENDPPWMKNFLKETIKLDSYQKLNVQLFWGISIKLGKLTKNEFGFLMSFHFRTEQNITTESDTKLWFNLGTIPNLFKPPQHFFYGHLRCWISNPPPSQRRGNVWRDGSWSLSLN